MRGGSAALAASWPAPLTLLLLQDQPDENCHCLLLISCGRHCTRPNSWHQRLLITRSTLQHLHVHMCQSQPSWKCAGYASGHATHVTTRSSCAASTAKRPSCCLNPSSLGTTGA